MGFTALADILQLKLLIWYGVNGLVLDLSQGFRHCLLGVNGNSLGNRQVRPSPGYDGSAPTESAPRLMLKLSAIVRGVVHAGSVWWVVVGQVAVGGLPPSLLV